MKVAPLIHAIEGHNASRTQSQPEIHFHLVHTGQHYDQTMSGVFFRELGIPDPTSNLNVGSGSHAVQTANIMLRFEPVLLAEKPDWLVVFGDVNSTIACTLVATKLGIRVAHVEAGLRSFDRTMPEEINRLLTDAVADLLLTPSEDANENLLREGAHPSRIRLVGNIMIDSLVANVDRARARNTLATLGVEQQRFAYVTLHRPSNVDHAHTLGPIMHSIERLAREIPIVFPMHPRTRKNLGEFKIPLPDPARVRILDPVGYHDSISLTEGARLVLTDSGGLQEESTFFRTPCLTLRPSTERPVTITVGSNRLTNLERLQSDLIGVLEGPPRTGQIPLCWDGRTSERVLQALIENNVNPTVASSELQ